MEIGLAFELVLVGATGVYAAALLRIWFGLGRLQVGRVEERPSATVLVAARNEEKDIGRCLEALTRQDYPGDYQILVLDDGSTDKTAEVVTEAAGSDRRIRLLHIDPAKDGTSAKKHALRMGLAASDGELVFVTDADCVVDSRWMSSLASHFEPGVGLVTGMVLLPDEPGLVARMRNLDFAAYSFCSAGAMATGWPLLATAMNLAYRRKAFEEAGGFGEHAHVVSGDDDLLLHTIVSRTAWRAAYAFGEGSTVWTQPVRSVGRFLNQRMRWASKSFRYPPGMTLFLLAAFTLYLGVLVGMPLSAAGAWSSTLPWIAGASKLVLDALVVGRACLRFGTRSLLPAFLPAELLHVPYILLASVGGAFGFFRWKGRSNH